MRQEVIEKSKGDINKMIESFFKFTGRLNRKPFLLRYLFLTFLNLTFIIIMKGLAADGNTFYMNLMYIPIIILTISQISLVIRRSHDLNFSWGWTAFLIVLLLFPLINLISALFLACAKGTEGVNIYGMDPLNKNINNKTSERTGF